ncbi:MAG: GNAT family N-acetyltransferase [Polaribacter sp.]|jgi:GNAT superfamily N-acetyltransferase|nr:GNAT family N-acetyltransferase [Polaribacter sp.]MBT5099972.1 GNAT family N-acetyltransferase [Polaribacter sp.]MBT5645062.1 GNAT family N-acetyltransferase [Polaribacter sp.]MBT7704450.1 GNAT family N-acetyltransferase [Polaribacter sp.]MDB4009845.1 GNAT family N-acetyltransferase [Polaribacter sp.]
MSFNIREAKKQDASAVLDLITELAVFEKEPTAVEVTVADIEKDGFSDSPKFKIFVAEEASSIIGIALIYMRYSTWKGPIVHLEDLIVTEKKRKLGVGKALYTRVLKYAHSLSVKRVSWEVIDWNTNAIDFYESTGATILSDWSVVQMSEENLEKFVKNNS